MTARGPVRWRTATPAHPDWRPLCGQGSAAEIPCLTHRPPGSHALRFIWSFPECCRTWTVLTPRVLGLAESGAPAGGMSALAIDGRNLRQLIRGLPDEYPATDLVLVDLSSLPSRDMDEIASGSNELAAKVA